MSRKFHLRLQSYILRAVGVKCTLLLGNKVHTWLETGFIFRGGFLRRDVRETPVTDYQYRL